MLSSRFRGRTRMRRLTLALFTLGLVTAGAQFIPDKSVVIHPAVESQPERGGTEGPGTGLGTTPLATRGGTRVARSGGPPPIPPPPPAPEIKASGAAVEQTTQGSRAAIEPVASFDGLGEGFTGRGGG